MVSSVLGAHDIVTTRWRPAGLLTQAAPDARRWPISRRGIEVLKIIGAADIGQACVVQQGIVLAVEAVEGTDAMLSRVPGRCPSRPGGVLVKLAKPGQERRADLPTIGLETIRHARRPGCAVWHSKPVALSWQPGVNDRGCRCGGDLSARSTCPNNMRGKTHE